MPTNFLNINNGIPKSVLDQIDLQDIDVIQGKKYIGSDGTLHTGSLKDQPNDLQCPVVTQYDPGTGFVYLALPKGAYRKSDGRMSPHPNIKRRLTEIVSEAGFDKGAWSTTINPGGSVTIPQGWHSGSGRVTANTVNPNMTLVNRSVGWGSGVRFSGDDTSASKACQFGLQYYAHSEYNVHIEFRIYRNNSHIDTVHINREGGLLYDPRGYIAKWYEGSGTYKYDVNITYHAGNGSLMIGGMIVGY